MENIDSPKLSKALLQRYTEQIKPPAVNGGGIFYGLACKSECFQLFLQNTYFNVCLSKLMEHTDSEF